MSEIEAGRGAVAPVKSQEGGEGLLAALALAGGAGVLAAFFGAPAVRFWANALLWFCFYATVGLGALFLAALEHLVGARWSVPLRRVAERAGSLVLLAVLLGLPLLFSLSVLYPWTRPEARHEPFVSGKLDGWLNVPFFTARALATFALWGLAFAVLAGLSLRQDRTADPRLTLRLRRFAPAFMALYAVTVTLLAFDWLGGLEPAWYSDIFGVYVFAGSFLAGLSATALGTVRLLSRGRLPGVERDHLYNLGGFLFAFLVFWSYIGFAQYLLMWYANLPEEVFYYADRAQGGWPWVMAALALLHFVLPFFALLPRDRKGDPTLLRRAAALVLVAHLLDLYGLIFPSLSKTVVFSWPEAAFALAFGSLFCLWMRRAQSLGADMPVGDPFLRDGLEFRL